MVKAGRRWPFKFFGEVISELKKVTWLSRQELIRLGIMVVAVTIAVGIILGFIDYGFAKLVKVAFLR